MTDCNSAGQHKNGSTLNGSVLVLNQSYEPISICSAKKALIQLYLTKAEMVAPKNGKLVHSVTQKIPFPSVIRLSRYVRVPYKHIVLSRKNILRRDGMKCQYCGSKTDLTIDHVIPKSRGGADKWDNLVAACRKCNNKKGNSTPSEAGMTLQSKPRKPNHLLFLKQQMNSFEDNWRPFLFMD